MALKIRVLQQSYYVEWFRKRRLAKQKNNNSSSIRLVTVFMEMDVNIFKHNKYIIVKENSTVPSIQITGSSSYFIINKKLSCYICQ